LRKWRPVVWTPLRWRCPGAVPEGRVVMTRLQGGAVFHHVVKLNVIIG
jgi:hypothetical protein